MPCCVLLGKEIRSHWSGMYRCQMMLGTQIENKSQQKLHALTCKANLIALLLELDSLVYIQGIRENYYFLMIVDPELLVHLLCARSIFERVAGVLPQSFPSSSLVRVAKEVLRRFGQQRQILRQR